ncbi:MAG: HEAT repeat protein [Myxococcota bacterium]
MSGRLSRLLQWLDEAPEASLPPSHEPALRHLIQAFIETDDEDWMDMARVFIDVGPAIAPRLREVLSAGQVPWWYVAAILGGQGDVRASTLLFEEMLSAEEPWELDQAMRVVGAPARPIYTANRDSEDPLRRSRARLGLGHLGEPGILPAMYDLLCGDDENLQESAADAIEVQVAADLPRLRDWMLTTATPAAELPIYRPVPMGHYPEIAEVVLDVVEQRPEHRTNAFVALRWLQSHTPRTCATLIAALQDTNPDNMRIYAAKNLAWMGFFEAGDVLAGLLWTRPAAVQNAVIEACGVLGLQSVSQQLNQWLWQALDEGDRSGCSMLCAALGKIRDPAAVPALIAVLTDEKDYPDHPHDYSRRAAATALGLIGGEAAVHALLDVLQRETLPPRREIAAFALSLLKTPAAAPIARTLLAHSIPGALRRRLLATLGACGEAADGALLIDAFASAGKDRSLAYAAIEAMNSLRTPQVLDALLQATHHADGEVRRVAMATMGASGPAASALLPTLEARYSVPSLPRSRHTLAVAIARISQTVSDSILADVRHMLGQTAQSCQDHNNRMWRPGNLRLVRELAEALATRPCDPLTEKTARRALHFLARTPTAGLEAELEATQEALHRLLSR